MKMQRLGNRIALDIIIVYSTTKLINYLYRYSIISQILDIIGYYDFLLISLGQRYKIDRTKGREYCIKIYLLLVEYSDKEVKSININGKLYLSRLMIDRINNIQVRKEKI